jgi:aminoglycoside adenylyltransferase-like protein
VRHQYGLQWLVLGVPRLHHTIATLEVTSKTDAGRYALEVAPAQWHVVLEAAMALRADGEAALPASADSLWSEAVDLSEWLIEDAHRLVHLHL